MEVLCLTIAKESFYHNLIELVGKVDTGLPSTYSNYFCVNCREKFCDSHNEFTVISSKSGDIGGSLEAKRQEATDKHLLKGKGCTSNDIVINKRYGIPKNYLVLYWTPQLKKDINEFKYQDRIFYPELLICKDKEEEEVLFALYKTQPATEDTFLKLLLNNFETHLDKDESQDLEAVLQDEESLDKSRHLLPKLYGGGRKTNAEAPYVCRWCPPDVLKHKNKGRFQLYGNYKQHFIEYHSSDVPFDEFIRKVKRNDKKWYCKNCGIFFSLSNKVRHQAICKKKRKSKETSSSSSSESATESSSDDDLPVLSRRNAKSRKRSKQRSSSEERKQGTPRKVSHTTQTPRTESIGVGTADSPPLSQTAAEQTESQDQSSTTPLENPHLAASSSRTHTESQDQSPATQIELPNLAALSSSTQNCQGSDITSVEAGEGPLPKDKFLDSEENGDLSLIIESVKEKVDSWNEESEDF